MGIAALGIAGCSSDPSSNTSTKSDAGQDVGTDRLGAFDVCKQFVSDQLKAPGGATWRDPFGDQVTYSGDGDGPITVDASVDSQNGFGAKLRSTYTCTVSRAGGNNWHLDNLVVNDGGAQ